MQLRAKTGFIATALVVAAGIAYGFMPRAVPVDAATVTVGPLTVSVEEEGKTRVRERYVVSAPVAGYVRRIALNAGDAVTAGQVLATIEPSRAEALDPRSRAQAVARVSAGEATVAAAQDNARAAVAASQLAQQERVRAESLAKSGFVSPQVVDTARSAESRARAGEQAAAQEVKVARFELEAARAAIASVASMGRAQSGDASERVQVRSPATASVLKLARESEGAVAAGQSLIEIGNPGSLEVEVEVLSRMP
jgi:HlyD family secretion protein